MPNIKAHFHRIQLTASVRGTALRARHVQTSRDLSYGIDRFILSNRGVCMLVTRQCYFMTSLAKLKRLIQSRPSTCFGKEYSALDQHETVMLFPSLLSLRVQR